MTTLKLKTSPSSEQEGKKPVRARAPEKRDRSKPPPKPLVNSEKIEAAEAPSKNKANTHAHRNNERPSKLSATRQCNHRYDGSLREEGETRSARNQESTGANLSKSQNTRTAPSAQCDEPHYRQAPRRQGKLRDAKARDGFDAPTNVPIVMRTSNSDLPRLSKLMAERGLCSRREADEWIENGWVKVDGEIIEKLGTRVSPKADIVISSYAQEHQAENVTILLHKPIGYVSGQAEDGYEPAVVLINPENEWQEGVQNKSFQRRFLKGLAPAGRLDIDSTGLLVLTQDGRIAKQLIGENSTIEKEYLVRVEGELSESGLKKLNFGLSLDGVQLKPAKVSWQNEDQLRFVLREGRKRQIRRMCELVGLKVIGLKRIRIGSITLGKLPLGQWRYLKPNERF